MKFLIFFIAFILLLILFAFLPSAIVVIAASAVSVYALSRNEKVMSYVDSGARRMSSRKDRQTVTVTEV